MRSKQTIVFGLLLVILIVALASQVRSAGIISTGSYHLDTPFGDTFWVEQYSNGTYFAINGSNWENFLRNEDASYIFNNVVGNMTNGGTINVGIGVFDCANTITMDKEGIYIEGESTAYGTIGTVFNLTGTNKALFNYTHANTHQFFGGISNAELRGNDGAGTVAIHVNQFFSDLWFEKLFIRDFAVAGIQVDGGASGNAANIVSKVWNIWIRECLIEENHAGLGYGVYLTDTDSRNHSISRVTIEGGHFHDNNHSIYSDSEWIFHLKIIGNTVEKEQQESIYLLGCRRGIISENEIFDVGTDASNTYSGIYIGNTTGGSPPVAIDIVDNSIGNHWEENQMKYCVELQGTCDHIVVTDNMLESWKTTSPLNPIFNNSTGTDIITEPNQGYGFIQGRRDYYTFVDGEWSGDVFNGTAGENLIAGEVVYLDSDGTYKKADCNLSTTMYSVGVALRDITSGNSGFFLRDGYYKNSTWSLTVGSETPIYVSSVAGGITQTTPNSTGDQVQIIAYAVTSDTVCFDFDSTVIEVG